MTRWMLTLATLAVVMAAALGTTVVRIGSRQDVRTETFVADVYGRENFPVLKSMVERTAVEAKTLAAAIAADKAAAGEKYGKPGSVGPIFPVTFSGVASELRSGLLTVTIADMPEGLQVRVQVGPVLSGTDLRDATGTVHIEQFTNQIEFQDAGAALNDEVRSLVLKNIDHDQLAGRNVRAVGVFQLIAPNAWMVTPVRLEVQ